LSWLKKITPLHIQKLVPYASARREASEGQVWLNANENPNSPYGTETSLALNRYPDFQPASLVAGYAHYAKVSEAQILVTRGIDEGIDLLTRTFCEPSKDRIIFTPPTYGMYKIAADTYGIDTKAVPLTAEGRLDRQGLVDQIPSSKLIYICSPNNPTGNIQDRSDIEFVLAAARNQCLVVLDEAYIEFSGSTTGLDLLEQYPNLIILRTMSKAFGLAGARCGFVLADPEIIQLLQKVSAPYPIPVPVVDLVERALSEIGIVRMREDVKSLMNQSASIKETLESLSFVGTVYPSVANFILFAVTEATSLMNWLGSRGIIIRNQSSQVGLTNTVRVTIGTEGEMKLFINAMKEYEEQS